MCDDLLDRVKSYVVISDNIVETHVLCLRLTTSIDTHRRIRGSLIEGSSHSWNCRVALYYTIELGIIFMVTCGGSSSGFC